MPQAGQADPAAAADDTTLLEAMHAIKDEFEAYGWRRVQAALRQVGWVVNHKKVKRLMREHGLHLVLRRRFVATTDSDHDQPIFPDRTRELAPACGRTSSGWPISPMSRLLRVSSTPR